MDDDVSIIFKNVAHLNKLNKPKDIEEFKLKHIQSDWPKVQIRYVQADSTEEVPKVYIMIILFYIYIPIYIYIGIFILLRLYYFFLCIEKKIYSKSFINFFYGWN